jgi:hypothetical protein
MRRTPYPLAAVFLALSVACAAADEEVAPQDAPEGAGGAAGSASAGTSGSSGSPEGNGGTTAGASQGDAGTGGSTAGASATGGKAGMTGGVGGNTFGAGGSVGNPFGGSSGIDPGSGGAPPENDACPGEALSVGSSAVSVSGSTIGATNDFFAPCAYEADGRDVMYAITPTESGVLQVLVDADSGADVIVFAGTTCGNLGLGCRDTSGEGGKEPISFLVDKGTTYYVGVDTSSVSPGTFSLSAQIVPPPAGATCPGVAVEVPLGETSVSGTTVSAGNDAISGPCSSDGSDSMLQITPKASGVLSVAISGDGAYEPVVHARTQCEGGAELACDESFGTATIEFDVVENEPVWIVVDGRGLGDSSTDEGTFTGTLTLATRPPFDRCADASQVPLDSGGKKTITGTTEKARADAVASCASEYAEGPDVFFAVTPTADGLLSATLTAEYDSVLAVWTGTCDSLSEVGCNDQASTFDPEHVALAVKKGTTYYVEVGAYGTGSGGFTLELSHTPPPTNDTCATAHAIPLDPGQKTLSAGTVGAADDVTTSCPTAGKGGDVMYAVTPSATGKLGVHVSGTYDAMVVVETKCGDATTALGCSDATGTSSENLSVAVEAGKTYYLVIDGYAGEGTFDLSLDLALPPVNDRCETAEKLDLDPGQKVINGSTAAAADDYVASCGGTGAGDTVYAVTPSVSGKITVRLLPTGYNSVIYVQSMCGDKSSSVACDDTGNADEEDSVVVDVDAAKTYFLIVDGAGTDGGAYKLTLDYVGVPPNDTCAAPAHVDLVKGTPITLSGDTTVAKNDLTARRGGGGTGGDVVYEVVPSADGTLTVTVAAKSGYDPVVYAGDTSCADASNLGCKDATGVAGTEKLTFAVKAATKYWVVVDGYQGQNGAFDVTFDLP